ncbi:MAG: hypothetical protein LBC87_07360 [Fibromonadaceae bacterium]|jgi:hypothetical protein|nr:hypothetical protein [Fibromonadaceae bacterium]
MNITTLCISRINLKLHKELESSKRGYTNLPSDMQFYYRGKIEVLEDLINFLESEFSDSKIEELLEGKQ